MASDERMVDLTVINLSFTPTARAFPPLPAPTPDSSPHQLLLQSSTACWHRSVTLVYILRARIVLGVRASLGWEYPLEEDKATHSSILA